MKTFFGLISEDIFFKLTLYFLKILNLNYKNNVYNLVFFYFLWFFCKHKISKNQKNIKLYNFFVIQNQKFKTIKKKMRLNQKIFSKFWFLLLRCGNYYYFLNIFQIFRKFMIFINNYFRIKIILRNIFVNYINFDILI